MTVSPGRAEAGAEVLRTFRVGRGMTERQLGSVEPGGQLESVAVAVLRR